MRIFCAWFTLVCFLADSAKYNEPGYSKINNTLIWAVSMWLFFGEGD